MKIDPGQSGGWITLTGPAESRGEGQLSPLKQMAYYVTFICHTILQNSYTSLTQKSCKVCQTDFGYPHMWTGTGYCGTFYPYFPKQGSTYVQCII